MKNIKALILDTTFILPLFGIKVDLNEDFDEKIQGLWKNEVKGFKVYLPSVCLIETLYKLISEYKKEKEYNIIDRYQKILPTIIDLPIKVYNCELNPKASMIATLIRHNGHKDIMDCWIAGTASALKGILLTEDRELKSKLKQISATKNLIVWNWNKYLKHIFN
jgi:predicted nucleic acid-binding protein